ncbi:MAG: AAA family ATPase [Treponema sp.]|jgi:type II secretory pathway predicted ATPase ExeA|nr:AAA family ATPase [Treponema sp.]
MFTQYFGLKFNPFSKELDEKDIYMSKDSKELVSRLEYIKRTKGFFLLTAESGFGKTTVLRKFSGALNPGLFKVCYSALSSLTVMDFYRSLVFRMGETPAYQKIRMFEQLQRLIYDSYYEKKVTPVFILDEAQSLSGGVLEDLRMIFNFKMDSENPFITIIAGNPNIRRKLQLSVNQALRQRITGNYHMTGLSRVEIGDYISSRLVLAGAPDTKIFTDAALESLFASSGGALRLVNTLAAASLTCACSRNLNAVDEEIVFQADRDIEI